MKIKNLDDFIENSFISHNVTYRKKKSDHFSEEYAYEMSIPLCKIQHLKLTNEEKIYIIKCLKNKGIIIKGRPDCNNLETEDYVHTKITHGGMPKRLSKEETLEKIKVYKKTKDLSIRDEIIKGNMELVANTLYSMRWDYELDQYDLLQAGYIGLMEALDRFDIDKGVAFSTYAVPCIKSKIIEEAYNLYGISLSEGCIYRVMRRIEMEHGEKIKNNPSLAEKVADVLVKEGIRLHRDENVKRVLFINSLSLEQVLENNENESIYELGYDTTDNPINEIYDNEVNNTLKEEIKSLKEKKRKILELRYGLNGNEPHTLMEIGQLCDMSHYGVSLNVESSFEELLKKNKVRALKNYLYREL